MKLLANLGDVNWLEYGGSLVFDDESLHIIYAGEADDEPYEVYRVSLDPCTYSNGVLSDNLYHPGVPAWFAVTLGDVAKTTGAAVDDIIRRLCAVDVVVRGSAYLDLISFHGAYEFDSYPLVVSRVEVEQMYSEYM